MGFERDNVSNGPNAPLPPQQRDPIELENSKPDRDWKRNVLIAGLGTLSWVATYVGMLELIEANMGDLPFVHKVIIGFSVAMLMIMIVWLLDQLFKPHTFVTKVFYATGYVFLTIISVGFGFGFYWKVLESRGEASRSAESAVGQVQQSLHAASTRLEQLQATLIQLTAVSTSKAELERTKGTSCPNSKPGDGPRRKLREEDAQRFNFASEFTKGRVASVKNDMKALDSDLIKIVSSDASIVDAKSGTRNEFMRALGRKLDMTVTGFNAFRTDPQLKQIRADLADRAEKTTFGDPKSGGFACPDAQLQTALRGVVKAIDQLPELEKPQIAAVEGSEATIEAFRRLTATFYGMLSFKMPPSADEIRELQKKAVQSVESPNSAEVRALNGEQGGLSKRDYVPLAVALFVDLCLFLVSMVQKPAGRLEGLMPKMQAAERGPVIQILSRFKDIHRDQQIRENFEIFRHIVFDMNGDYYAAVPLDAPPKLNPHEREELRVEAQLLSNLFASFEKERIFKRTMLPTTASIQKRLKRQGSKFAAAEAFRVYKFTDGAWSDIILGAVMGAARRIDDQNRRAQQGPMRTVNAPFIPPNAPAPGMIAQAQHGGPAPVAPQPYVSRSPAPGTATPTRATQSPVHPSLSIDPDHSAGTRRNARPAPQYPPADPRAPQSPRVPRPAPQPHPEAEVVFAKPANSNTAGVIAMPPHPFVPQGNDDARSNNRDRIVTETAAKVEEIATNENTVDVTLSRETATFSMPVNKALMPDSLKKALSNVAPQPVVEKMLRPSPRPDRAGPLELEDLNDDETVDPVESDSLTARELAFLSRMAPPAAE